MIKCLFPTVYMSSARQLERLVALGYQESRTGRVSTASWWGLKPNILYPITLHHVLRGKVYNSVMNDWYLITMLLTWRWLKYIFGAKGHKKS